MIFFWGGGGEVHRCQQSTEEQICGGFNTVPKLIGSEMSLPVDSLFNFVNVFQLMNK